MCTFTFSVGIHSRFTSHSIHVAHFLSTSSYRLQTVVSVWFGGVFCLRCCFLDIAVCSFLSVLFLFVRISIPLSLMWPLKHQNHIFSDAHDLNGLFVTLFEFYCMLFCSSFVHLRFPRTHIDFDVGFSLLHLFSHLVVAYMEVCAMTLSKSNSFKYI